MSLNQVLVRGSSRDTIAAGKKLSHVVSGRQPDRHSHSLENTGRPTSPRLEVIETNIAARRDRVSVYPAGISRDDDEVSHSSRSHSRYALGRPRMVAPSKSNSAYRLVGATGRSSRCHGELIKDRACMGSTFSVSLLPSRIGSTRTVSSL